MKKAISLTVALAAIFSLVTVPAHAAYTDTNYFNEVWYARCSDRSTVTIVTTETVADGAPESDPGESQALNGLVIDGHAIRVSSYSSNDAYFRQQVPVENGKTYRLTGKIRTGRGVDDQTWLLITSGSVWAKTSEYRIASLNTVAGAYRSWRNFDYTFTNTVADNCKYLTFYTQNWGSMLLDNLSLKEVLKDGNGDPILDGNGNQCYSEELIRNGDFEPATETTGSAAIAGWEASWNTPREDCEAGIDLIENSLGKYVMSGVVYPVATPEGSGMVKIWQGAAASDSNFNATLLQRLTGMDTTKTYLLTGKVWVSSNQTYLQLVNTDFNSGSAMDIYTYYGNNRHRWENLSVEFTPTNPNVEVKFQTAKSERKIYLDDLSVKEIEKENGVIVSYGEELLINGRFEPEFAVRKKFYPSVNGTTVSNSAPQSSVTDMVNNQAATYICGQALIVNTLYDSKNVNVFLAAYNNGNLCDFVCTNTNVVKSVADQPVNLFRSIPDLSAGNYEYRLFVWDSDNMPLCKPGIIAE